MNGSDSNSVIIQADLIHTMDSSRPTARAALVTDGRIRAIGGQEELAALAPRAPIRRFDGATVIPGLVESHVHPLSTAMTTMWADCRSPGRADIAAIQHALRRHPVGTGGWIRGWGYDDTLLTERRHLNRHDLDAVARDLPIVVTHISGHFAAANSRALELAGISDQSVASDDPGYPRDAAGRLTGTLVEVEPVLRVLDCIPMPDQQALATAFRATLEQAVARGATTIHDLAVTAPAIDLYRTLEASDDLPLHVVSYLRGDLLGGDLVTPRDFAHDHGNRFRVAGVKFWADGSIQGLTAALRCPYTCDPSHSGGLLRDQRDLVEAVARADALGAQIAIHANGDAAVAAVIDALAPLQQRRRNAGGPHRIEHCQVVGEEDLARIATAGLGVSFFVNHVFHWGDRHRELFLGEERAQNINPLADAASAGVRFGLHSDSPITPIDPLRTLWAATERQTSAGLILGGHQRIDFARAVRSMTLDSAWLTGQDHVVGSLAAGKRADLVVIDGDPDHLSAALADARVAGVMVEGRWHASSTVPGIN